MYIFKLNIIHLDVQNLVLIIAVITLMLKPSGKNFLTSGSKFNSATGPKSPSFINRKIIRRVSIFRCITYWVQRHNGRKASFTLAITECLPTIGINSLTRCTNPSQYSGDHWHVHRKKYLIENQFTIADIAVVSVFLNMALSGFPLQNSIWPNLAKYLEYHYQRESFAACVSDVEAELARMRLLAPIYSRTVI